MYTFVLTSWHIFHYILVDLSLVSPTECIYVYYLLRYLFSWRSFCIEVFITQFINPSFEVILCFHHSCLLYYIIYSKYLDSPTTKSFAGLDSTGDLYSVGKTGSPSSSDIVSISTDLVGLMEVPSSASSVLLTVKLWGLPTTSTFRFWDSEPSLVSNSPIPPFTALKGGRHIKKNYNNKNHPILYITINNWQHFLYRKYLDWYSDV